MGISGTSSKLLHTIDIDKARVSLSKAYVARELGAHNLILVLDHLNKMITLNPSDHEITPKEAIKILKRDDAMKDMAGEYMNAFFDALDVEGNAHLSDRIAAYRGNYVPAFVPSNNYKKVVVGLDSESSRFWSGAVADSLGLDYGELNETLLVLDLTIKKRLSEGINLYSEDKVKSEIAKLIVETNGENSAKYLDKLKSTNITFLEFGDPLKFSQPKIFASDKNLIKNFGVSLNTLIRRLDQFQLANIDAVGSDEAVRELACSNKSYDFLDAVQEDWNNITTAMTAVRENAAWIEKKELSRILSFINDLDSDYEDYSYLNKTFEELNGVYESSIPEALIEFRDCLTGCFNVNAEPQQTLPEIIEAIEDVKTYRFNEDYANYAHDLDRKVRKFNHRLKSAGEWTAQQQKKLPASSIRKSSGATEIEVEPTSKKTYSELIDDVLKIDFKEHANQAANYIDQHLKPRYGKKQLRQDAAGLLRENIDIDIGLLQTLVLNLEQLQGYFESPANASQYDSFKECVEYVKTMSQELEGFLEPLQRVLDTLAKGRGIKKKASYIPTFQSFISNIQSSETPLAELNTKLSALKGALNAVSIGDKSLGSIEIDSDREEDEIDLDIIESGVIFPPQVSVDPLGSGSHPLQQAPSAEEDVTATVAEASPVGGVQGELFETNLPTTLIENTVDLGAAANLATPVIQDEVQSLLEEGSIVINSGTQLLKFPKLRSTDELVWESRGFLNENDDLRKIQAKVKHFIEKDAPQAQHTGQVKSAKSYSDEEKIENLKILSVYLLNQKNLLRSGSDRETADLNRIVLKKFYELQSSLSRKDLPVLTTKVFVKLAAEFIAEQAEALQKDGYYDTAEERSEGNFILLRERLSTYITAFSKVRHSLGANAKHDSTFQDVNLLVAAAPYACAIHLGAKYKPEQILNLQIGNDADLVFDHCGQSILDFIANNDLLDSTVLNSSLTGDFKEVYNELLAGGATNHQIKEFKSLVGENKEKLPVEDLLDVVYQMMSKLKVNSDFIEQIAPKESGVEPTKDNDNLADFKQLIRAFIALRFKVAQDDSIEYSKLDESGFVFQFVTLLNTYELEFSGVIESLRNAPNSFSDRTLVQDQDRLRKIIKNAKEIFSEYSIEDLIKQVILPKGRSYLDSINKILLMRQGKSAVDDIPYDVREYHSQSGDAAYVEDTNWKSASARPVVNNRVTTTVAEESPVNHVDSPDFSFVAASVDDSQGKQPFYSDFSFYQPVGQAVNQNNAESFVAPVITKPTEFSNFMGSIFDQGQE